MSLGKEIGTRRVVNRELLEISAAGMKLIRKPSQVGATNFRRLCDLRSREVCLSRAPKDFAGLTAVEPGGHPADGRVAVNLCESTLMGQIVSILIFHRLTLIISSVTSVIDDLEVKFLEEIADHSSFCRSTK